MCFVSCFHWNLSIHSSYPVYEAHSLSRKARYAPTFHPVSFELSMLDQMSPGVLPIFLFNSRHIGISILLLKNKTKQTTTKMSNILFFMPEKMTWLKRQKKNALW